jgi:murein DD-endopeptidase MepM/ murein hydrolase activator NlpD
MGQQLHAYRKDAATWQALIGLDIDRRPGRYVATVDAQGDGAVLHAPKELIVQPHTFPTRRLRVNEAFVNPPPELAQRIAEDSKILGALGSDSNPSPMWTGPFVQPVPAEAVGRFGARSIFNGQPRSPHGGDDFPSPEGTPVKAPNAGRIILARDLYFAGNTVAIDHGLRVISLLEHLSAIDVGPGDVVAAGQVIGRVGATGRVTGPHLHWAVHVNGARVDPRSVLALLGETR